MSEPHITETGRRKRGIADTFSRAAATYDQPGPRFFSHFGQRLVELVGISLGAQVLDVATGRGASLFAAAERVGPGGQVTGIDLAEGMVQQTREQIRRLELSNVTALQMDAEALDFPNEMFDVILCGFAIFFFPNLEEALAEFRRVLKPGGKIAITTWGQDDERWAWLGDLQKAYLAPQFQRPAPPPGQPSLNKPEGMQALLEQAGFAQVGACEEAVEFAYANEEEWLAVQWSHGQRFLLENLPPESFETMKAQAFAHLAALKGDDGIPHRLWALYTIGVKP